MAVSTAASVLWPGSDAHVGIIGDSEQRAWMDLARCTEVDSEIFFPVKGESTRAAKLVCSGCEVREACLQYAMDHQIDHGIWGGVPERERQRLRRTGIARYERRTEGDKHCPHCNRDKPVADFASHTGREDGLQSNCRDCNTVRRLARKRAEEASRALLEAAA